MDEQGNDQNVRKCRNLGEILTAIQSLGWEITTVNVLMHTGGFGCEMKIFQKFPPELAQKNKDEKFRRKGQDNYHG